MLKSLLLSFFTAAALLCSFPIAAEEASPPSKEGELFPEGDYFRPFAADPRRLSYSMGFRVYDRIISSHVGSVSLGEIIPLYRWYNVNICDKEVDLQLSLGAGAWAVFDFDSKGDNDFAEFVNSDYYAGFSLTCAHDKWSYRTRFYHISSHLGDEYILSHPTFTRLNPSYEVLDFFASYDLTHAIRFYLGAGYVLQSDSTFSIQPLQLEGGAELRLLGRELKTLAIFQQPFFAMHIRSWEDNGWQSDSSYVLGFEWSKMDSLAKKISLYLEYHEGFSLEGQFSRDRSDYLSINFGFGN